MPLYEYKCKKGHQFEVLQSMSDDAVTECEVCGAPVQRVFYPIAVHFKGSGFYNTDYGKQKKDKSAPGGDSNGGGSESTKESKSDSKGESKKESKSDSKSGSKSSSDG